MSSTTNTDCSAGSIGRAGLLTASARSGAPCATRISCVEAAPKVWRRSSTGDTRSNATIGPQPVALCLPPPIAAKRCRAKTAKPHAEWAVAAAEEAADGEAKPEEAASAPAGEAKAE